MKILAISPKSVSAQKWDTKVGDDVKHQINAEMDCVSYSPWCNDATMDTQLRFAGP